MNRDLPLLFSPQRQRLLCLQVFVIALLTACGDGANSGNDVVATLQRSSCYGTCPVYKVQINQHGIIHYVGEQFVSTTGEATDTIARDSVAALIAAFDSLNYNALPNRYLAGDSTCGSAFNHAATVTTSLSVSGKTKSVVHYLGCGSAPRGLVALEHRIDSIVRIDRWTKRWLSDKNTPPDKQSVAAAAMTTAAEIWAREHHIFVRDSTIVFEDAGKKHNWTESSEVPDARLIKALEVRSAERISAIHLALPKAAQLISLQQIRESFEDAPTKATEPFAWIPGSAAPRSGRAPRSPSIALSPMVFSEDSATAMIFVRRYCGQRCSMSELVWLVRESDATWRVKARRSYGEDAVP